MNEEELFGQLKEDLATANDTVLEQNPVYASTIPKLDKMIDFYWNSKYLNETDADDSGERDLFFYNIIHTPVWVASRLIDLDTKDLKIFAEGDQHYLPVLFFEKELKVWIKEQLFAKLMNDLVAELPRVGHVIVKKVGEDIELVDIDKLKIDPTVEHFYNSDFVIEHIPMTPSQLKREAEDNGWNMAMVEEALKTTDEVIDVYEYYNLREEGDNYHIITGASVDNENEVKVAPKVLHSGTRTIDDLKNRYKEHKWENVKGRHRGRGFVELLFENQVAMNDHTNMHRSALNWTSKRLFWTADDDINKNSLHSVDNGYVFHSKEGINPIANEERNLSAYQIEDSKWQDNTQTQTFSHESVRGEQAPSGTPLGSVVLQAQQATGFFNHKREELGIFIKSILMDWVIPSFQKQQSEEHVFNLLQDDEDFDRLMKLRVNDRVNKYLIDSVITKGRLIESAELQTIRQLETEKMREKREVQYKIPSKYYKNPQYKMDFNITDENIDVRVELQSLQFILQQAIANPGALQTPIVKRILQRMANLSVGINPNDLDFGEAAAGVPVPAQEGTGAQQAAPITPLVNAQPQV